MKILLGVPGGVAAYKALEFARLAVKAGHSLRVVQTPASLRFVGRASFAAITGAPVLASEFESDPAAGSWPGEERGRHTPISHLALAERADVVVVAPATANTLARLASGAAEDLVTACVLTARCPVVIAPAMNGLMWTNAATSGNVESLRSRGMTVLEPAEGDLASHGEEGKGRLVEPDELLAAVEATGSEGVLNGVRILVTAGGTREPLDSVRYIGNRSSGRMGVAVAEAASALGAEVTVVGANLAVPVGGTVTVVAADTASEMESEVVSRFPGADVLVMAAAVADFVPVRAEAGKIDKSEGIPALALEPAVDILSRVAGIRRESQLVVGFAAEHGSREERAREKLVRKQLDMVVFNDISQPDIGFDSSDNAVTLVTADGTERLAKAPKADIAKVIVSRIAERIGRMDSD